MAAIDLRFLQKRTDNGFAGFQQASPDFNAKSGKLIANRYEATTKRSRFRPSVDRNRPLSSAIVENKTLPTRPCPASLLGKLDDPSSPALN